MYEKEENNKYLRPKLLFVDDDLMTIDVVVRILKNKYDVDTVNNGQDGKFVTGDNYFRRSDISQYNFSHKTIPGD